MDRVPLSVRERNGLRKRMPVMSRLAVIMLVSCASTVLLPGQPMSAVAGEQVAGPQPAQPQAASLNDSGERGSSAATVGARVSGHRSLSGKERWDLYVRNVFWSPGVFFASAGPALGAQLNNEPPSWGQGAEGFSKRFANRYARFTLQKSYEAAGAAALGHEVRYLRSNRPGFGPRAIHALTANFVTYDRSGRRTPHIAKVGSVFAAEFTGRVWMPDGYRDTSTVMRGVGLQLGIGSAFNLIREFSPELKRIIPWK